MKNRKVVGVLLLVVAVVWSIVIWRIAGALGDQKDMDAVNGYRPSPAVTVFDSIRVDYPDPFLKSELQVNSGKQSAIRPSAFFVPDMPLHTADTPSFLFRGRLRRGKRAYVLLESDGRREIVGVGDVIDGFRIVKSAGDSAVFVKGNQRYVLKK